MTRVALAMLAFLAVLFVFAHVTAQVVHAIAEGLPL